MEYEISLTKHGIIFFTYKNGIDYKINETGFYVGNFDTGNWFLC